MTSSGRCTFFLPITLDRNELESRDVGLVPQCSSGQGASTDMQHDLLM